MRTEDDSWDITSSVGATALGVATMRARESERPDALFHDPYARLLVHAVGSEQWRKLLDLDPTDIDQDLRETYTARSSFMVARTCFLDDYCRDAAAAGVRQFVILAAGLDARAYRLDWPAGTVLFELDQPKVLAFKGDAMADNGVVTLSVDRRAVAIDLRHDWPAALRDNGFDPDVPTAWLAEGLLRYLPADAQDRLFEHIAALSPAGSRFAANCGASARTLTEAFADTRTRVLERVGIDLDVNSLLYEDGDRTDPREWFPAHGWTSTATDVAEIMAELGRPVPGPGRAAAASMTLMSAIRTEPRGDTAP